MTLRIVNTVIGTGILSTPGVKAMWLADNRSQVVPEDKPSSQWTPKWQNLYPFHLQCDVIKVIMDYIHPLLPLG